MLTNGQKQTGYNYARASLELLQQDLDSFMARFTTIYETCLHYYDLETNLQSWKRLSPPTPKKFKKNRSARKNHGLSFLGWLKEYLKRQKEIFEDDEAVVAAE
ncbi:hypothetical protein EVAR_19897_1 [Eumeta japonica]|uniref:Uncharacterized protein n=1 Tax=Eumeta variegata TaxID=151549 RepID=A0A4C1XQG8_EUMVA|nr:hypothetical protein EVAR_19897_1 [Eumeta japonica]